MPKGNAKQVIEDSLNSFNQITSPKASLRQTNYFEDKSFVDVEYTIPEGLDEETCKIVVLGALLDEKICGNLETSSTGADMFGKLNFARDFYLENVFSEKGDEREQKFGKGIKEARLAAKEALDKFKEDPSLVGKYINNAAKVMTDNLTDPFRVFSGAVVMRTSMCGMIERAAKKENLKDHVNLSNDEMMRINLLANAQDVYAEILAKGAADKEKDKSSYLKGILARKLLEAYVAKGEKDFSTEGEKAIEREMIGEIWGKHPDVAESMKKDGIKLEDIKELKEFRPYMPDKMPMYEGERAMRCMALMDKYSEEYKNTYRLLSSFNNSAEMSQKLFDIVSSSRAYEELMQMDTKEMMDSLTKGDHFIVFSENTRQGIADKEHEEFMGLLDGAVNSKRLVAPLENIRDNFKKTEGVLHGASDEYKEMISDLFVVISDSEEIGNRPSKAETLRNFEKMQKLQKSVDAYIQHKTKEPDTGSTGTKRLKEANGLKDYLAKEIERQQKRIDFNFKDRVDNKDITQVYQNEPKKKEMVDHQLEGFYNMTSGKVTLRENNAYENKEFADVEYEIPEGLDKDTCCLITLGAMLDEKVCEGMETTSTGANQVGKVAHARTMILDNILNPKGDEREGDFSEGLKTARENAKKAIEEYKKDPKKAFEYIGNVAKYSSSQISNLFAAAQENQIRFLAIEQKALDVMKKEPFKSGVEIPADVKERAENAIKGIDVYVGAAVNYTPAEMASHKEQYINQQLTRQLLGAYSNFGDKDEKERKQKELADQTKAKVFKEHPELMEIMDKKGYPPKTTEWGEISNHFNYLPYVEEAEDERDMEQTKMLTKFADEKKAVDKLVSTFDSSEEFTASMFGLVSTSKYANELKDLSPSELKVALTPPNGKYSNVFVDDLKERDRMFLAMKGQTNTLNLVEPLEKTAEEFAKTEGFFHGHKEKYGVMVNNLKEFIDESKKMGRTPSRKDVESNIKNMENLIKSVDDYITYKEPLMDTGATGTKRLSEAKKLRTFLTEHLEDQKNVFSFNDKKNIHKHKENVTKEVTGLGGKDKLTEKVKVKTLSAEKENVL